MAINFNSNIVQAIIGSSTSKAAGYLLTTSPFAYIFGSNTYGQLGLNDTVHRSTVQTLPSDNGWKNVSCGKEFTLFVDNAFSLFSCGRNDFNQLGLGIGFPDKSSPVQVGFNSNWQNVAAGDSTALAITNGGALYAWGNNAFGAVGNSTNNATWSEPQLIDNDNTWTFISAGLLHNMAIRDDGTLWAWGKNSYGQLGDDSVTHRSSPVQVIGSINWTKICAGYDNTIGIDTDGYLWSWGRNNFGQLGLGDTVDRSSPVKIGTQNKWAQAYITDICATAQDIYGYQWTWGSNNHGGIGKFTPSSFSSPVQTGISYNKWYVPVGVRKGGFFAVYSNLIPVASPTTTPSPTTTASPTPTPSISPSETPSPTPSESPTPTPTESPSPTPSPSPSPSPTPLPSPTPPFDMRVIGDNSFGQLGGNSTAPYCTPYNIGFNP